jgi:hypothetical protein
MKKLFFACLLSGFAAVPAFSDQGCIEISTTTVTATVCTQFDCVQQVDGNCVTWNCSKTQTSKYVDANTSGCTRVANCGSRAVFEAGEPAEPDTESTEECDWYPCVQADPVTKACYSYMCVSKRVSLNVHTTYPNARCIPAEPKAWPQPLEKKTEPRQQAKPQAPIKKAQKVLVPLP